MWRLGVLIALAVALAVACSSSNVSRSLGARCTESSQCDERCLAPGNDYPGGLCTETCDSDGDCPGNARCVTDEGGVCLYLCDGDPACTFLGTGWTCGLDSAQSGGMVMVCRGS